MSDTSTPSPTAQHHFNLTLFLQTLLALAPAIAAPFIKSPGAQQIEQAEIPVVGAIITGLGQSQQ